MSIRCTVLCLPLDSSVISLTTCGRLTVVCHQLALISCRVKATSAIISDLYIQAAGLSQTGDLLAGASCLVKKALVYV